MISLELVIITQDQSEINTLKIKYLKSWRGTMKRLILSIVLATGMLSCAGCGNLSPRLEPKLDQKIDNQNGRIGQIETLQNSIKAEVGKIQSQAEITNSQLDRIQQGLINLQQNNDNHGVQIFSGTGGLLVAVVALLGMLMYFRSTAKMHEKTASILAEKMVSLKDQQLENSVFEAVLHTNVAENMLKLIKKQKSLLKLSE
jgi:predicted PurR-regulated permease PerM